MPVDDPPSAPSAGDPIRFHRVRHRHYRGDGIEAGHADVHHDDVRVTDRTNNITFQPTLRPHSYDVRDRLCWCYLSPATWAWGW